LTDVREAKNVPTRNAKGGGAQRRQIISAEVRVLRADAKVLAHGTTTLLVSGGTR
jgi:hypothetical protein